MAASTRTKAATNGHSTSNTALTRKVDALTKRVEALEDTINSAKQRQQQALAAKLAQNPQGVAQLRQLLELVEASRE